MLRVGLSKKLDPTLHTSPMNIIRSLFELQLPSVHGLMTILLTHMVLDMKIITLTSYGTCCQVGSMCSLGSSIHN